MTVTCKICDRQFDKLITNSHLKSHSITTSEYKKLYGEQSLSSPQYRAERSMKYTGSNNPMSGKKHNESSLYKISQNRKGKEAWNKGLPLSDETKLILSEKANIRNLEWHKNNQHPFVGRLHSDKTKEKIRNARSKQIITSEQAKKAATTRIKNGWVSPTLGKSLSEEHKEKIKKTYEKNKEIRYKEREEKNRQLIASKGFIILENNDNWYYYLECKKCDHKFTTTKQYFNNCKFQEDYCQFCPVEKNKSRAELELQKFVEENLPDDEIYFGDRSTIHPLELDIHIRSKNIAIEYCDLYYHSESNGKDKEYHLKKLQKCEENGIQLIYIFEDEWISKKDIVKNVLKNKLGLTKNYIGARKTVCKKIENSKEYNKFLNENHLQGSGRSNVAYGLYYDDELVSVMTFSNENISRKIKNWEINRFCTKVGFNVQGGMSKLFKSFIKDYDPASVISYVDRRWGRGESYYSSGFELVSYTPPSYWYFKTQDKRIHRFALRKNKDDDPKLTEYENRLSQGWKRIWDCGNIKLLWEKTPLKAGFVNLV